MKRSFFAIPLFFSFLGIVSTQPIEKCGFDRQHAEMLENPIFRNNFERLENSLRVYKAKIDQRNNTTIIVPVAVHVIHNGDALGSGTNIPDGQIFSAIANMNEAFSHTGVYANGNQNGYNASTGIQFALAQTAPDGSPTTGINRVDISGQPWAANYNTNGMNLGSAGVDEITIKNLSRWPTSDYLNIWVVNRLDGGNLCSGTIGFAYFPFSDYIIDGIAVIAGGFGFDPTNSLWPSTLCSNLNLNGTVNHEAGHYFSLFHTFQGDSGGGSCPADITCGTDSDCCGDIPPHIRSSGCSAFSSTGNSCTGGPNTYIYNFMDYSSDACYDGFSNDQATRMDFSVSTSGGRSGFISTIGYFPPSGTYPPDASCTPSSANNFNLGPKLISLNGTNWYSGNNYSEGAYLDRVAIQPTVELNAGDTYTLSMEVFSSNPEKAQIYIDFNNDGDFTDSGENVGSIDFMNPSGNTTINIPASGITLNQRVRMRIITDFSGSAAISGPCHNPEYGQIEDYALRISGTLPTQLSAFDGKSGISNIELLWETTMEWNNDYFILEKSKDGKIFQDLVHVDGQGESLERVQYRHTDSQPYNGTNFYRLKQVDHDGTFEYSRIIAINFELADQQLSIYPNPASGSFFIEDNSGSKLTDVNVYDHTGKKIESFLQENNEVIIRNATSGLYVAEVIFDTHTVIKKLVVK